MRRRFAMRVLPMSPAFATPSPAFRELRHPAAMGYQYRDI
jgi:hypothetical protein